MLDLKTTSFEDIIGCLKAYEERINSEEEATNDENKLMYANMEPSQANSNQEYGDYRSRGRGGRFYGRGRGRGRSN